MKTILLLIVASLFMALEGIAQISYDEEDIRQTMINRDGYDKGIRFIESKPTDFNIMDEERILEGCQMKLVYSETAGFILSIISPSDNKIPDIEEGRSPFVSIGDLADAKKVAYSLDVSKENNVLSIAFENGIGQKNLENIFTMDLVYFGYYYSIDANKFEIDRSKCVSGLATEEFKTNLLKQYLAILCALNNDKRGAKNVDFNFLAFFKNWLSGKTLLYSPFLDRC